MATDRGPRVSEIFHAALACEESERAAFLQEACGGDERLRLEVASLLDQKDDGFLDTPASALPATEPGEGRDPRVVDRERPDHLPRSAIPWWITFLAASFVGNFALVMFSTVYPPAGMGVRVANARTAGVIVESVIAGFEGDRAGVRPGDRLLAINNRPLRHVWEYHAFSTSVSIGEERTWLFERSGRQFSIAVTPDHRQFFPLLRFLPNHIGLLASLVLSLVVIHRRPADRVARLGALLLASMACAVAPPGPVGLAGTWRHLPVLAGAALWPAWVSAAALGALMFSFCAVFPRRLIVRPRTWIAVLAPAAVVTAWFTSYQILVVYRPELSLALLDVPGWVAIAAFSSIPVYFAAAVAMLVWGYRRSVDLNERRRTRVLLCGMTAAALAVLYLSAPVVAGIVDRESGLLVLFAAPTLVASPLFVALPCCFAYAIVAQRLFDVRLIVRKGIRYAFARRGILLLVPALAAGFVADLVLHGEQPLDTIIRTRGWTYAALAALAALVYRYRDRWMTALDRRFFREAYDAHRILKQVVDDVRSAAGPDTVAPSIVARMSAAFHPTFVALLVSEPHQRDFQVLAQSPQTGIVPHLKRDSTLAGLARVLGRPVDVSSSSNWLNPTTGIDDRTASRTHGIELVTPVVMAAAHQREALLVLGMKRSEEPYDGEDRELVRSVAASLAPLFERRPHPAHGDGTFMECPQCGGCDDVEATRCREDGTPLVRANLPRILGGRYTIQQRLGRGGMGTVYEARDGTLERRVAIKVIRDDMVGRPDAADRFRREALLAASFSHPNVVTVHDFGITDSARGYFVMERLTGESLRERLQRERRLTTPRALHVIRGVTQAVDAAHRRALIHRDLKPDNVFLTTDDVPKVLDFGIAKFLRPASDSIALTATGACLGTLGYMSPEQILGGTPHESWDLWALAVLSYEMLEGVHPFAETGRMQGAAVASGGFAMTAGRQDVPSSLQSLFADAFSADRAARPSGALAFLDSLERALDC